MENRGNVPELGNENLLLEQLREMIAEIKGVSADEVSIALNTSVGQALEPADQIDLLMEIEDDLGIDMGSANFEGYTPESDRTFGDLIREISFKMQKY